jgi:DNA-binding transcriptional MerR regulator
MYIGKVAEKTGASRKAIRLYEARGLIPPPERQNTYRIYSERHVFMVHMIKQAQEGGFNLTELEGLIGAVAQGNTFPLDLANRLVAQKQDAIARDMAALVDLQKRLGDLQIEMNKQFIPG